MSRPDDTTIPWPVGREYHSSCLLAGPLTGHQHPVVVVVGGRDNNRPDILSDLWIMKREQTWKKVCLGIMNNTHVHVKYRRCLCLMVCSCEHCRLPCITCQLPHLLLWAYDDFFNTTFIVPRWAESQKHTVVVMCVCE